MGIVWDELEEDELDDAPPVTVECSFFTATLTSEEIKVVGDWQHGITKCSAMYLLRNDIKRIYKSLKSELSFFANLDSERQYALIDMAFNLGVFGLLRFKKMLKALEKGNYKIASQECLASKYAKDVGIRASRIAHTIETGEFRL